MKLKNLCNIPLLKHFLKACTSVTKQKEVKVTPARKADYESFLVVPKKRGSRIQ